MTRAIINTKRIWIWFIILWAIHNAEEAITMSGWMSKHARQLPFLKFISLEKMQHTVPVAILIATVLLIVIPVIAVVKKWDNRVLGVLLGVFFINALQHILTTIVLRNYAPGVITAALFNLPFSFYWLKKLISNPELKNFTWVHVLGLGVLVFIISLLLIWALAFLVEGKLS